LHLMIAMPPYDLQGGKFFTQRMWRNEFDFCQMRFATISIFS